MPWYFISVLLYFWLPAVALAVWLLPKLDRLTAKAVMLTFAVLYPTSFVLEYVYLSFDLWSFSEKIDPLLGPRLFGVPVEEFFFWYGAQAFVVATYLAFHQLLSRRRHA